jgi:hypothetical protein
MLIFLETNEVKPQFNSNQNLALSIQRQNIQRSLQIRIRIKLRGAKTARKKALRHQARQPRFLLLKTRQHTNNTPILNKKAHGP